MGSLIWRAVGGGVAFASAVRADFFALAGCLYVAKALAFVTPYRLV